MRTPTRRHAFLGLILALVAALLYSGAGASTSAVTVPTCTAPTGNLSNAKVLTYAKCIDARVSALIANGTPSPTPTPTVTPTPTPTTETVTPTPTQTPSPTATPTPSGGCVGAANTAGGPDPWGGCWPGPHNTGYPHGLPGDTRTPVARLTAYTGPQEIRSCGVVIENKIVPWLVIRAGNGTHSASTPCVTIRNSKVETVFTEDAAAGPVLIEDSEMDLDGSMPYIENAGRYNFFTYRVNSHGGQGVIKCAAYCESKDNWVHGMTLGGAYHYNALGGNGMEAGSWNIEHNFASCGDWESTQANVQGDAGCSSVIGFYGDFAPIRNIRIHRNFLASTFDTSAAGIDRQAAYCLNPGYYPGKPYPNTSNLTVTDNIFARGGSGRCGVYGPTNSLNGVGSPSGNVWSGNRYTDGAVIPRPEE